MEEIEIEKKQETDREEAEEELCMCLCRKGKEEKERRKGKKKRKEEKGAYQRISKIHDKGIMRNFKSTRPSIRISKTRGQKRNFQKSRGQ